MDKSEIDEITQEALNILKISGFKKNSEETYKQAKSNLDMIDITIKMIISEVEKERINKLNLNQI